MKRRFQFWMMILALAGWLPAGCSSSPLVKKAEPASQSDSPNRRARGASRKGTAAAVEEMPVQALAHFAAAFSHDLNGNSAQALEEYCRAALANPSYEPVVIEAARRCIRSQKPDRALEVLTPAATRLDASGTLYAWLGLAYGQAGKKELAISANRTAIKKMPRSLPAYQNLAQIYFQDRETNAALQVLGQAADQSPNDATFLIDLAELYSRFARTPNPKDDPAKGRIRGLLDRAADLGPKNPLILHRLGDSYLQLGEPDKAEEVFLRLVKIHPDIMSVRGKLADLYLRAGKMDKASEQLEAIAKEDPTNPRTQSALGAIALGANKLPEAASFFERALLLNPEIEPVYYDLAGVKLNLRKPEEALALLEKARSKFRPRFVIEYYTAMSHVLLKNYREARNSFTSAEIQAKASEPARLNQVFYYQFGSACERAGDYDQAEKHFQKCLALAPNYAEAMNYLGYMWTEQGVKLDQAHALIEKAVELEPKNPAFLDSLGWILFKLNQPKEALPWLLKSIENSPEPDSTLFDHLGDIYAALKEFSLARDAWCNSLSVELSDQIKQKLEAAPGMGETPP